MVEPDPPDFQAAQATSDELMRLRYYFDELQRITGGADIAEVFAAAREVVFATHRQSDLPGMDLIASADVDRLRKALEPKQ